MSTETKSAERNEVIEEFSKWGVGAGILLVALAPLAIPILALTGAALVLMALPVIPLILIAGLVYLPVRVVRGLRAHRRPLRQPRAPIFCSSLTRPRGSG